MGAHSDISYTLDEFYDVSVNYEGRRHHFQLTV